jgi:type IV secretory pathway VirB2 component (pilin)
MNAKLDAINTAIDAQTLATQTLQATIDTLQANTAAAIASLEAKLSTTPGDAELQAILDKLQGNTANIDAAIVDAADTPLPTVQP